MDLQANGSIALFSRKLFKECNKRVDKKKSSKDENMQAPSVRIDRSDDTIKTNARSRTLSLSLCVCFFARACARALCDENRLKRVKRICLLSSYCLSVYLANSSSFSTAKNVQSKNGRGPYRKSRACHVAIYSAITD